MKPSRCRELFWRYCVYLWTSKTLKRKQIKPAWYIFLDKSDYRKIGICIPKYTAEHWTYSGLQYWELFFLGCFCLIFQICWVLNEMCDLYFCVTAFHKKSNCVFITYMKKTFKSSSFSNISNFLNGVVWNPSKVQRSLFQRVARFL